MIQSPFWRLQMSIRLQRHIGSAVARTLLMPVIGERRDHQKFERLVGDDANTSAKHYRFRWRNGGGNAHLDLVHRFTKLGFGPTTDSDMRALGSEKLGESESETL